jgi:hypothetical protein
MIRIVRTLCREHFFNGQIFRTTPVNNIQSHVANVSQALVQIAPSMLKSVHGQANTKMKHHKTWQPICFNIEGAWPDKSLKIVTLILNIFD